MINRGKAHAGGVAGGITQFLGSSQAGTAVITNDGSEFAPTQGPSGGWTRFVDQSSGDHAAITNRARLSLNGGDGETHFDGLMVGSVTAGQATITNEGGAFEFRTGGITRFQRFASAGTATFVSHGGAVPNAFGGSTYFSETATGGSASFTNRGGMALGAEGGFLGFFGSSNAAQASIRNEGGAVAGALGGVTFFTGLAGAGNATLHALAGVAGSGGGRFSFLESSEGGTARVILEGAGAEAGQLLLNLGDGAMGIGSIEGTGFVDLDGARLSVGTNDLNTEFAGIIVDGFIAGGRLNKVGTGTLVLSGDNTYTGLTTVQSGILRVTGSLAGAVSVQGGVLGGNGMIAGPITVGPGGLVSPGASIGSFVATGGLTFDAGSAYELEIDSFTGTADSFSAASVAIGPGVSLLSQEIGAGALPLGLQLQIITNTSSNPTLGTFANLDEGAQFPVGNNFFRISYGGGDGNDVVLTNLVPEPGSGLLAVAGLCLGIVRRRKRR